MHTRNTSKWGRGDPRDDSPHWPHTQADTQPNLEPPSVLKYTVPAETHTTREDPQAQPADTHIRTAPQIQSQSVTHRGKKPPDTHPHPNTDTQAGGGGGTHPHSPKRTETSILDHDTEPEVTAAGPSPD